LLDPALQGVPHLFVIPGAKPSGADEDGAGARLIERFFQPFLPRLAGDEVPFVEPDFDPGLVRQAHGERFDSRFVFAVVR
jgi:hypothetical protein